jgi:hypothetical protein
VYLALLGLYHFSHPTEAWKPLSDLTVLLACVNSAGAPADTRFDILLIE